MSGGGSAIAISNVKVSFRLWRTFAGREELGPLVRPHEHTFHSNFCVVRWPHHGPAEREEAEGDRRRRRRRRRRALVATVFFSGFVNVTGIRRWEDVEGDVRAVCLYLRLAPRTPPCVDNITASGDFACVRSHFQHVVQVGPDALCDQPCLPSYNSRIFPALFLRTPQGTVAAYPSGKCVLVGSRSLAELRGLTILIQSVFRHGTGLDVALS